MNGSGTETFAVLQSLCMIVGVDRCEAWEFLGAFIVLTRFENMCLSCT